jgi:hypothetical protein
MECVGDPKINCEQGGKCPEGYECCSQQGNKGRLGLCVKKDKCDKSRGIPVRGCKGSVKFSEGAKESVYVRSIEGYTQDADCSEWDSAFWVLFLVILAMIFFGVVLVRRCGI